MKEAPMLRYTKSPENLSYQSYIVRDGMRTTRYGGLLRFVLCIEDHTNSSGSAVAGTSACDVEAIKVFNIIFKT